MKQQATEGERERKRTNVVADGKRLDAAAGRMRRRRRDTFEGKKFIEGVKAYVSFPSPTKFLLDSRISRRTLREGRKKNHSQMKEKEEER